MCWKLAPSQNYYILRFTLVGGFQEYSVLQVKRSEEQGQVWYKQWKICMAVLKICPREVPRVIRLSWEAQRRRTVWLPVGPPVGIFKAWALWANAFYKLKCPNVCVCVHFVRYRLNVFLPPLPEVGCPIILEFCNPWGKVIERSGLRFEHFSLEVF